MASKQTKKKKKKAVSRKKVMKEKERQGLNPLLTQVLTHRSNAVAHNIFSAVRGPDNDAYDLKAKYTTPIRCWIYNMTPDELAVIGALTGDWPPTTIEGWQALRAKTFCESGDTHSLNHHYLNHIRSAIAAIIHLEEKEANNV